MRAKAPVVPSVEDLSSQELVNIIDTRHELVRLAGLIDWTVFDRQFGAQFVSTTGRPALPMRLVAVLLYLKHLYALSDEEVVQRWVENPYTSISAASGTLGMSCRATRRASYVGESALARKASSGCWPRRSRPPSEAAQSRPRACRRS